MTHSMHMTWPNREPAERLVPPRMHAVHREFKVTREERSRAMTRAEHETAQASKPHTPWFRPPTALQEKKVRMRALETLMERRAAEVELLTAENEALKWVPQSL